MTNASASNSDNSAAYDDAAPSSSYFQKTVCLKKWWLIKSDEEFEGKRLAVGGFISQEKQAKIVREFTSAPILKRTDSLTLETVDRIYVLIDSCIDKVRTKENGFPSEVCNHFLFGFPINWEEYVEQCLGKEHSNKSDSATFDRDKLSTGVDDISDRSLETNKAAVSEERHDTGDKMNVSSEEKGHHKPQDGACNDFSLGDPKLSFSHVVSGMGIYFASEGYDLQNNVTSTFEPEFQVGASIESPLPKSSDVDNAHKHKTASSMNLQSSSKRSDTPERNNKLTVSPEKESLPTGTVVEGNKISEVSENTIEDIVKCPSMYSNISTTNSNFAKIISSSLKNLRNQKDRNVNEETLNAFSAAGTARSVWKGGNLEGISLCAGKKHNRSSCKMKIKLKGDPFTYNPLEFEENRLTCGSTSKKKKRNVAINGRRTSGCRSTSIPSAVGLQPTDGETVDGNTARQSGKQSKNTSRTLRSSVGLSDANQIADVQIAGSKEKTNVKNANQSGEKTTRKLTYESPVTKRGTGKTTFVSPETSSFRRSRSGRLLLPTLEFWRNQVVVYDADRTISGIQEDPHDVEPSRGSRSEPQRKQGKLR